MKIYIFIILLFCLQSPDVIAKENSDKVDQEIPESISLIITANDLVSDEEVLVYLKKMFKYMPEEWEKLNNQSPSKKSESIQNFRNHHSYNGIAIADMVKAIDESPDFEEMMAQIWGEDTLGVEYAESVLLSLSKNQYLEIIKTAQDLIKKHQTKEFPTIKDNFPEALKFLEIKHIRVSNSDCEIYLYKGIGSMKAIGFNIEQEKDGSWQLSHFNYLKSYDHIPIDLDKKK